MKKKRKKGDKKNLPSAQTSCFIHVENDSKLFKIARLKVLLKSGASPINRASTIFIRQSLERVGKRALRAEKIERVQNFLEFKKFSLVIFFFQIESSLCCQ